MKKIITVLLCFNIIQAPLYAYFIRDEFIENTLDKNLNIKNYQFIPIEDEFVLKNKSQNPPKRIIKTDEILPENYNKYTKKPIIIDEKTTKIKIKIKNEYSTKSNLDEGNYIEFVTLEDINIKNKTYPKNSIVKARLETISNNRTWGVPSDIVVSNFTLDSHILSGEISKTGANRALWVYPTVYGTSWLFGAGLLFIFIRGGHAKIKPSETFILEIIE